MWREPDRLSEKRTPENRFEIVDRKRGDGEGFKNLRSIGKSF